MMRGWLARLGRRDQQVHRREEIAAELRMRVSLALLLGQITTPVVTVIEIPEEALDRWASGEAGRMGDTAGHTST
jgi:hypothetical protein